MIEFVIIIIIFSVLLVIFCSGDSTHQSVGSKHKENKKKKHSSRCDGDCENCPPHYGYRHGRWYYGHSHTEGCTFGGNKCDGGRD